MIHKVCFDLDSYNDVDDDYVFRLLNYYFYVMNQANYFLLPCVCVQWGCSSRPARIQWHVGVSSDGSVQLSRRLVLVAAAACLFGVSYMVGTSQILSSVDQSGNHGTYQSLKHDDGIKTCLICCTLWIEIIKLKNNILEYNCIYANQYI